MNLEWTFGPEILKEAMKRAEDQLNYSKPSTITKSLSELFSMKPKAFS
jgi:hypothetical protein